MAYISNQMFYPDWPVRRKWNKTAPWCRLQLLPFKSYTPTHTYFKSIQLVYMILYGKGHQTLVLYMGTGLLYIFKWNIFALFTICLFVCFVISAYYRWAEVYTRREVQGLHQAWAAGSTPGVRCKDYTRHELQGLHQGWAAGSTPGVSCRVYTRGELQGLHQGWAAGSTPGLSCRDYTRCELQGLHQGWAARSTPCVSGRVYTRYELQGLH